MYRNSVSAPSVPASAPKAFANFGLGSDGVLASASKAFANFGFGSELVSPPPVSHWVDVMCPDVNLTTTEYPPRTARDLAEASANQRVAG